MFEVAAMIGKIEKFFDQEVQAEDFWELPAHYYELYLPRNDEKNGLPLTQKN